MFLRILINGFATLLGTIIANGGIYLLYYYVGGFDFIWTFVMSMVIFLLLIVANLIKLLIRIEKKVNSFEIEKIIKKLNDIESNYNQTKEATISTLADALRLFRKIGGENGL